MHQSSGSRFKRCHRRKCQKSEWIHQNSSAATEQFAPDTGRAVRQTIGQHVGRRDRIGPMGLCASDPHQFGRQHLQACTGRLGGGSGQGGGADTLRSVNSSMVGFSFFTSLTDQVCSSFWRINCNGNMHRLLSLLSGALSIGALKTEQNRTVRFRTKFKGKSVAVRNSLFADATSVRLGKAVQSSRCSQP
jgi:hypothetical protein